MNLFKDERGISNLIATLILIAVAVVGGAFAYTAFRNQAQSVTTNASLQVQGLDAVKVDGTTNLSATVKNVGTQRLENVEVDVGGNVLDVGNLGPGQTGSISEDDSGTGGTALNAGQEYVVKITADTLGGGSISKTMTVRVQ